MGMVGGLMLSRFAIYGLVLSEVVKVRSLPGAVAPDQ